MFKNLTTYGSYWILTLIYTYANESYSITYYSLNIVTLPKHFGNDCN